ncbi:MAG TPA: AraC family transcriptional regulator [Chloroflexi bacterium]|nr:AraC family transcriptional regulator [Chloroflexota bacterium]
MTRAGVQRNARQRRRAELSRHLLRARDFIDANYAQTLSIADIARAAHLSSSHFARQFRAAFGETPHQYLSSRRLERAASLLRNTDYSVAHICVSVGFASVGSFTSAFGRAYRLTPTRYRAQHLPALIARVIPPCVLHAVDRPQLSRIGEDAPLAGRVGLHVAQSGKGDRNDVAAEKRDIVGARPGRSTRVFSKTRL